MSSAAPSFMMQKSIPEMDEEHGTLTENGDELEPMDPGYTQYGDAIHYEKDEEFEEELYRIYPVASHGTEIVGGERMHENDDDDDDDDDIEESGMEEMDGNESGRRKMKNVSGTEFKEMDGIRGNAEELETLKEMGTTNTADIGWEQYTW